MAEGSLAGDTPHASAFSFPAATAMTMPSATARATAAFIAGEYEPPSDKLATAGVPAV